MRCFFSPRFCILACLFFGLYIVPSIVRWSVLPRTGFLAGLLLGQAAVCWMVAFFGNSSRFAFVLFAAVAAFELAIESLCQRANLAIWLGGLIPALLATLFAERLYRNMGD